MRAYLYSLAMQNEASWTTKAVTQTGLSGFNTVDPNAVADIDMKQFQERVIELAARC